MKLAIGFLTLTLLSGCVRGQLSLAAYNGDLPTVNTLLGRGADPNSDSGGVSPLHMAVLSGNEKVAFNLIGHGAKIDKMGVAIGPSSKLRFGHSFPQTSDRKAFGTPTMISAATGDKKMFMFLIRKGADVNLKVERHVGDIAEDASALHFAAAGGNPEIVSYLIDAGTEIDGRISNSDNTVGLATPLHIALKGGNIEAAKLLLESGADVNATYLGKTTVLHDAAYRNATNIINFVIEHGANIEAQDNSGYTALSMATFKGNIEAAEVLLVNGANLSTDNDNLRLSYVYHLAADLSQNSDPEKSRSLYVKALDLYEENIPELEKEAQNQAISDVFWVALANVASMSISRYQAQVQAKQLGSISALNASGPATYTHYYTVPILTGAPWPNTHEAHAARSKLGAERIRAIIQCADAGGSTLVICSEKANQIKPEEG